MKQSNFLRIGWRDLLRSFLVAFLTFIAYYVQGLIPDLNLPEEVKAMISAGIGYLIKNFLTKPDDTQKEDAQSIIGGRPDVKP